MTQSSPSSKLTKLDVPRSQKQRVPPSSESPDSTPQRQFGLLAIFWIFLALSMVLAYLRRMDSPQVWWGAVESLGIALACGAAVGWSTRRWADALSWAIIISSAAYLSVASDAVSGPTQCLVWATIGALTGSLGATIARHSLPKRILVCSGAAAAVILIAYAAVPYRTVDSQFDLLGAPFIGGMVAILIWLTSWLESRYHQPRYVTASWLLAAVVVGNALGSLVHPWLIF